MSQNVTYSPRPFLSFLTSFLTLFVLLLPFLLSSQYILSWPSLQSRLLSHSVSPTVDLAFEDFSFSAKICNRSPTPAYMTLHPYHTLPLITRWNKQNPNKLRSIKTLIKTNPWFHLILFLTSISVWGPVH